MKPDTRTWLDMAETDLAAAEVLFERGLLPNAIFFCHLTIEKLLKAFWVEEHMEGFPPRIHDLVDLASRVSLDLSGWDTFLADLSTQGVASRYAARNTYSQEQARSYWERTQELWRLLRQHLN